MHIEIKEPSYMAGDTVHGGIHLSLKEIFPAKVLQLEICGEEKTKWVTEEKSGSHRYKKKHIGKKSIFTAKIRIHAFTHEGALPGQYTFPFSF